MFLTLCICVYAHNYYDLPLRKIEPHSGNSSVSEPHTHEPQAYRYYSKAQAITSLHHAVTRFTRFIVSPDLLLATNQVMKNNRPPTCGSRAGETINLVGLA